MLRVMFFAPLIPGNTGSAIRIAAGVGAELHLVEPLGFTMDEPRLRRAGLDYHDLAHVVVHPDLDTALAAVNPARVLAFTTQATTWHTALTYRDDDVLLFGPETTGLPDDVLARPEITTQVRIPLLPGRRSMNLSNAAAVATYEAWRTLGFPGGI